MSNMTTPNLSIPLVDGADLVAKENLNDAFDVIDQNAVSIAHLQSPMHFDVWKKTTAYAVQDTVRTTTGPNWGVYVCVTAGTSDVTEPAGYGAGDIITDGTVTWKLCPIGGGGSTISNWATGIVYTRQVDFCLHQNRLYQCLVTHTSAAAFQPNYWQAISVDITPFQVGRSYEVNDFVIYDKDVYYCLTAHISTAFIPANWQKIGGIVVIDDWAAATEYKAGQLIVYNGAIYRAWATFTSGAAFNPSDWQQLSGVTLIDDWATATDYTVKETVVYDEAIYRCNTAHTSTSFAADAANWEQISISRKEAIKYSLIF